MDLDLPCSFGLPERIDEIMIRSPSQVNQLERISIPAESIRFSIHHAFTDSQINDWDSKKPQYNSESSHMSFGLTQQKALWIRKVPLTP
jgi:hypothetical protein